MMVDDVSVPTSQKFIYFHQSDHTDRPCPQHSTVALLYDRCNLAALITIPIINGILKFTMAIGFYCFSSSFDS